MIFIKIFIPWACEDYPNTRVPGTLNSSDLNPPFSMVNQHNHIPKSHKRHIKSDKLLAQACLNSKDKPSEKNKQMLRINERE